MLQKQQILKVTGLSQVMEEREGRQECAFKEVESDSSSELLRVASVTQ